MEKFVEELTAMVYKLNDLYKSGQLDDMEYVQMLNNLEQARLTYLQTKKK